MEVIYLKGQELNIQHDIVGAIGFFDGLHKGHMALVDEVCRISQETGYKKALITFDHHPLYVLKQVKEEKYLTTITDRQELLEKKGIDYLFVICFSKEVAALSPQDFIQQYLIPCHIQHIVCGFDFRFGKNNQGDVKTLQQCSYFTVSVVDEVIDHHQKISSSRIRESLQNGDIPMVNHLLGRVYKIKGKVIYGKQIGRTIGFPTANIDYQSYLLPQRGVYAVKVIIDGQVYLGMCNIGLNPTFHALNHFSLEVNIFEFHQDIYGKEVVVEFYQQLRSEKKFQSQEELMQQLHYDQNCVRKILKGDE